MDCPGQVYVRTDRTASGCFQNVLIAFLVLIFLVGLFVCGVGVWLLTDRVLQEGNAGQSATTDISFHFYIIAYLFIAVGIGTTFLVFITSALGCIGGCAIVRQNLFLFIVFIFVLLVDVLLLLGVGSWALLQTNTLHTTIRESLRESIRYYFDNPDFRHFIENIQKHFECCGADTGFGDYAIHGSLVMGDQSVEVCEMSNFAKPCEVPVVEHYAGKLAVVSTISICAAFVMLIGILLSTWQCCSSLRLRNQDV